MRISFAAAALALLPLAALHAQVAPPARGVEAPARGVAAAARAEAVAGTRWTPERANAWYAAQPWILGANYTPANAINQLEMWQAATFDPAQIDKELGWAKRFGMNSMRVYLHDLTYSQDPRGFLDRVDRFLAIAAKHDIKIMLVLFDSCWNPDPVLGPQHRPIPGVHNSGWVQSPGRTDLIDRAQEPRLRAYVEGGVGRFAKDPRVLAWDIWNEPDNDGGGSYRDDQLSEERTRIEELLERSFGWARSRGPVQPLTSGVWIGPDWSPGAATLNKIQRIQLAQSDVITFHNYEWPESFEARIAQLRPYGRPIINTEWLARGNGSNVETILPIAARERVGMINWGFVQGRTQTHFPWDSWERPYTQQQPSVWFHDLLRADGTAYRPREEEVFRRTATEMRRAPAR